jgi:hypothetical protein
MVMVVVMSYRAPTLANTFGTLGVCTIGLRQDVDVTIFPLDSIISYRTLIS